MSSPSPSADNVASRNSKSIEEFFDTLIEAGLSGEAAINRTLDYAYLVVRESPPVREGGERCIYSSEYWSYASDLTHQASQLWIEKNQAAMEAASSPAH